MRHLRLIPCLLLIACSDNPFAISDTPQPFAAPANYRVWYGELEACSGLRGNYDAVSFYTVPDTFTVNGKDAGGVWHRPHSIFIRQSLTNTKWLIDHEIMHDLLNTDPKGRLAIMGNDHPLHYFQGVCGDLLWMNQIPA